MSPFLSVFAVFFWRLLFVSSLPRDDVTLTEETWIGRALWENEKPGEGWDPRSHLIPPSHEFIDFAKVPASDPEGLGLVFKAFGKKWELDLSLNTFLLSSTTKFDVRNERGDVLSSTGFPFSRNCFYIGSVRAGDGESGLAAISTCKGIRGMLTTNVNDYAIQPNGLHGLKAERANEQPLHRIQVQEVPQKFKKANMTIPSHSLSPGHPLAERVMAKPHGQKDDGSSPFHTTLLPKETPPRRLESELALIVDKEFQEKYAQDFPDQPDRDSLILFLTDTVNWMQMWYVHSTFGYQIWYHLTQVVLQSEKFDYTKYPGANGHDMLDQVCNWQAENHKDSASWDHTIFMSNKNAVFGTRADGSEYEGLAILGGECSQKKHCVGVKSSNFQWSAWHRTVAHESGHEFGALDDYQGESAEVCMNGLMRRGVFKDHEWAHCSLEDFEAWFPKFNCLLDSPTVGADAKIPSVPTNIAFRAEAEQSSTFISETVWGAWKATDGPLVSPTWEEGAHLASCTQTMEEDNPWLRIKLAEQFLDAPFDWIRIVNRWDNHGERLSNLEVRVGDNIDAIKNEICFRLEGQVDGGEGGATVFKCDKPMKGKYVSIHLLGKDRILTICELQVFRRGVAMKGIMPQRQAPIKEGETCVDVDADCAQRVSDGKCNSDEKVKRRCRKSCGLCVTGCWDTADDCNERKNFKGMCYGDDNAETLKVCKKTCNFCGCIDTSEHCAGWARDGECITNPNWVQTNCRKSCKTCDGKPLKPPPGCVNHHVHCDWWAGLGECNRNPMFMHHHCSKACNTCDKMPCMDYGIESTCHAANAWVCRTYPYIKKACRKSCGYCINDGREDLLDMVCYNYADVCGKGSNTKDKCYNGKGWGDWMFNNCKKFCNYCEPGHPGKIIKTHPHYKDGVTGEPTGQPTAPPTGQPTVPPSALPTDSPIKCRDDPRYSRCRADAEKGRCKIWGDYMKKHCAKSCGYCGHEGICADDVDLKGQCPKMKDANGCDIEWMQQRCAKTCDTCFKNLISRGINDGREDLLDMVCYDNVDVCGKSYITKDQCYKGEGWGDWMFENCKKFCNYCEPGHPGKIIKTHPHYKDGVTGEPTGQPTAPPTGQPTVPPSALPTDSPMKCRDDPKYSIRCRAYAEKGRCKIWGEYMKKHCPKSCGYCGHEGICADDVDLPPGQCPKRKDAKGCDSEWMQQRCAKTCDTCFNVTGEPTGQPTAPPTGQPTVPPSTLPTDSPIKCRDDPRYSRCRAEAEKGRCKIWGEYMKKHCAKSCGYCGHVGICADDVDLKGQCPKMKDANGCDSEWMQQGCAKTCDTCFK